MTEEKQPNVFKEEEKAENTVNATTSKGETSIGLDQNVAGLLCYLLGFISGLILFLIEKENKFVRFHAMQSLVLSVSIFLISLIAGFIPVVGWIISLLIAPLSFILWIVMMVKAYKGEWFKLPVIGDFAEEQANK